MLNFKSWARFCLMGLILLPLQAQTLRFSFQDYPPFHWEENEKAQGISVDIVRKICEKKNLLCTFTRSPTLARFLLDMKNADTDGTPSLVNDPIQDPERNVFLNFTIPIFQSNYAYLGIKHQVKPIQKLEELKNFTIGAVRNSTGEKLGQQARSTVQGLTIIAETNVPNALNKLFQNHYGDIYHSAILVNQDVALYYAKSLSLPLETIFVADRKYYSIALSKKLGNELPTEFNAVLKEMKQSGELQKMASQYNVILAP